MDFLHLFLRYIPPGFALPLYTLILSALYFLIIVKLSTEYSFRFIYEIYFNYMM